MSKKNSGPVYDLSEETLRDIVKASSTITDICTTIGIMSLGGARRILLRRLAELDIPFDHIPRGLGNNKGILGRSGPKTIPIHDMLTENSSHARRNLKRRLLKEGILENKCALCGQGPEWNGKSLVLSLDHENGINNDNRLANLRILCPNCHSQTDTFAGKNVARKKLT